MKNENFIPKHHKSQCLINIQKKQYLNKMPKIDKQEILQKYEEFQLFMNWNNAPKFEIDIFERNGSFFAWVTCPTKESPCFILHVHQFAKEFRTNDYIALLYHEFTHIYDFMKIAPILRENKAMSVFDWYSEAHAVTVSLMYQCGFKSHEELKKINITQNIGYLKKEISLDDYFTGKFNEIKNFVDKNDYTDIIKPIWYYLGSCMFYWNYCTFSSDYYIRLLHEDYFIKYFGTIITKITKIICSYDLSPEALNNMMEYNKSLNISINILINDFENKRI